MCFNHKKMQIQRTILYESPLPPGGSGSQKPKLLRENFREHWGGEGFKVKKPFCWRGMDIFTQYRILKHPSEASSLKILGDYQGQ